MTRLHLRPKAQIKVRRHPAGGGNAHLRCMELFESRTHAKKSKTCLRRFWTFGASDVTRTRDLLITSEMHYRLCYTSMIS